MKKLKIRILICYRILFLRDKHWIYIPLTKKQVLHAYDDKDIEVDAMYHGLEPYILLKTLKRFGDNISDIDVLEQHMKFEAENEFDK